MLYKHKIKFIPVLTMVALIATSLSINISKAASVGVIDLLLTNQNVSVASNQTISFYNQTAVALGNTITLTFAGDFNTATITEDDVDVEDDTVDLTTAADCSGSEQASVAIAADVLTITICAGDGGAIAAGSRIDVKIGTHATGSGTGVNQITNPGTVGTYTVVLGGTFGDTGTANVYIIAPASVTITATVDPTISFSVAPLVCNLGNLNASTDPSVGPAGTCSYTLTHATNAATGMDIKASTAATGLTRIGGSGTGNDLIPNGANPTTGVKGHGVAITAINVSGTGDAVGAGFTSLNNYVALSGTPATAVSNTAPHNTTTSTVTHRASVDGLNAAGSYTQSVTWTATGNF